MAVRNLQQRIPLTMPDYADTIFNLVEYELWCNLQANVMRTWSRCVGPIIDRPFPLPYQEAMTLAEIRKMFIDLGASWLGAAKTSHERGLLGNDRRLNQVFHLITHGTHHRGQLLSMITLMGYGQPFEGGDFGGWSNVAA
jgi:hypothetical protein